jgi:hypothetical protein
MRLTLRDSRLHADPSGESRPVSAEDAQRLGTFAARYDAMVRADRWDGLVPLGRELRDWLDGDGHFLAALGKGSGPRRPTACKGRLPSGATGRAQRGPDGWLPKAWTIKLEFVRFLCPP